MQKSRIPLGARNATFQTFYDPVDSLTLTALLNVQRKAVSHNVEVLATFLAPTLKFAVNLCRLRDFGHALVILNKKAQIVDR